MTTTRRATARHFNPRAPRGARPFSRCRHGRLCDYFNPRAPRGARPCPIWAPLPELDFNPRAPRGARQFHHGLAVHLNEFQSTRPARGATRVLKGQPAEVVISIHAPREGRDGRRVCCPLDYEPDFNPRAPRGARLPTTWWRKSCSYFNPRAPRGARRAGQGKPDVLPCISIHAPLAGRDGLNVRIICR